MTHPPDFRAELQIEWALVQLLDGVKRHDLPGETGLADEDCDRIWEAGQRARAALSAAPQQGAPSEDPPDKDAPSWYNSDMANAWEAGRSDGWTDALTRWGAQQAADQLAGQWPEAITDRPPTEADGDERGYVQFQDDKDRWLYEEWRTVDVMRRPWHHTPRWQPPAPPTLQEQALELLDPRAVIDRTIIAYSVINNQSATMEGHARLIAAAALRAAVEQVLPEETQERLTYTNEAIRLNLQSKRGAFLAIATELENQ